MRLTRSVVTLLALAALALAGCGSDSGGSNGSKPAGAKGGSSDGDARVVQVEVKPDARKFVDDTLEVPAGKVTLELKNPDPYEHNIVVEGPGGVEEHGELVGQGETSSVTVDLKAGETYEFYCDPHKSSGMKGTLVVNG